MIHSTEENTFLTNITNGKRAWLGGHRTGTGDKNWSWIDGRSLLFTNWANNQPDNYHNETEYCLHINFDPIGTWNDINCDQIDTNIVSKMLITCLIWFNIT